jgi:glutamate racemase
MNGEQREKPIAVFDSGVGGLPYLGWLSEHLPEESLVYMADNAHFPYGEKTTAELQRIIPEAVEKVIAAADPKLVVIACNTASVVALADLRRRFGIPFVGVVPAVKPAAERSANGRIGIFATRKTIEDPYTDDLVRQFASGLHVARFAEGRIVELVERSFFSTRAAERRRLLQPAADYFLRQEVDHLVLACTHFVFLRDELEEMMKDGVSVIDSREGVGRQVMRILEREGLAAEPAETRSDNGAAADRGADTCFYMTRQEERGEYRHFADLFGLSWGGAL